MHFATTHKNRPCDVSLRGFGKINLNDTTVLIFYDDQIVNAKRVLYGDHTSGRDPGGAGPGLGQWLIKKL